METLPTDLKRNNGSSITMKKNGWYLLPAVFFLLINFAVSYDKYLFLSRLNYFFFFVLLFVILRRVNLERLLPPIIGGISFILYSYGIIQKFILFPLYIKQIQAGDNLYSQTLLIRLQTGRIYSIFPLPTLYAIICVALILFSFHYFLNTRDTGKKAFWIIILVMGLFNLVLTQSFGGIFILLAGGLIYLITAEILKFKYLAPVLMVLSLFIFLTIALRFSEVRAFEPIKFRFSNWAQCVRLIGDKPLWGTGLGSYETEAASYFKPREARSIYAHNFFLQFAAETGLVISLALILFLIFTWNRWKPSKAIYKEKNIYITVFSVLLLYNAIDIGFYFFSAGIIAAVVLSQIFRKREDSSKPGWISGIVFLSLFIFSSLFIGGESISDNYQNEADFLMSGKNFSEADSSYRNSLKFNPFNYRSYIGLAYISLENSNLTDGSKYLEKARNIAGNSATIDFLQSKVEYYRQHFLSSFYYAEAAYQKHRLNDQYKSWYLYLKNSLDTLIKKSESAKGVSPQEGGR